MQLHARRRAGLNEMPMGVCPGRRAGGQGAIGLAVGLCIDGHAGGRAQLGWPWTCAMVILQVGKAQLQSRRARGQGMGRPWPDGLVGGPGGGAQCYARDISHVGLGTQGGN